jgi:tetratricopeptide (TPR) repeat protein
MRGLLVVLLVALLTLHAGNRPAYAQSGDLDRLFAQLRESPSSAAALSIETQIWNLWMHGGSHVENEALAKATLAMNSGNSAQAERQLNALINQTQNFPEAYNKRATLYFLMGRYEESLSDIVKTLELEPRHFGALSGRGMIMQRLSRDAEAIAAYQEALTMNPKMEGAKAALRLLEKQAPDL